MRQAHRNLYHVEVIVVNTDSQLDNILPAITASVSENGNVILGFDCEWVYDKRTGQKKVSLVQIAFEKNIYLIRICKIKTINAQLSEILENPLIIKTGKKLVETFVRFGETMTIKSI